MTGNNLALHKALVGSHAGKTTSNWITCSIGNIKLLLPLQIHIVLSELHLKMCIFLHNWYRDLILVSGTFQISWPHWTWGGKA